MHKAMRGDSGIVVARNSPLLLTVSLAACAHYFKVTGPSKGKVCCTEDIDRKGSAVELKDAQTGGVVTRQNSEITHIEKQAHETVVGTANK